MFNRYIFMFLLSSVLFCQSIYSEQKVEKKTIDKDLIEWNQDIKKIKDPELLELLNQLKQDFIRDKQELRNYYKEERKKVIRDFRKRNKKDSPISIKVREPKKKLKK